MCVLIRFNAEFEEPPIANAMFEETDQPFVADRIEERAQIGVDDPIHLLRADRVRERVKRIVLATPRPESV